MDLKRLSAPGLAVALGVSALLALSVPASAASATVQTVCAGGGMGENSVLCLGEPTAGTALATYYSAGVYVRPGAVFLLQDQAPGGATLTSPSFPVDPNQHYSAQFDLSGQPAGHTWCLSLADDQFYDTFGPGPVCQVL